MILVCWRRHRDCQEALRYCRSHGWTVNLATMEAVEPVFGTTYRFKAFERGEELWGLQGLELKGVLGLDRIPPDMRGEILARVRP